MAREKAMVIGKIWLDSTPEEWLKLIMEGKGIETSGVIQSENGKKLRIYFNISSLTKLDPKTTEPNPALRIPIPEDLEPKRKRSIEEIDKITDHFGKLFDKIWILTGKVGGMFPKVITILYAEDLEIGTYSLSDESPESDTNDETEEGYVVTPFSA